MRTHDKGQFGQRATVEAGQPPAGERGRVYTPPRLTILGRLCDVTLGSPFLTGDSGGQANEQQPGP